MNQKTIFEPSTKKPETRRKTAIHKLFQYAGESYEGQIELPIFQAKLVNQSISYEQMRTRCGLSDKAIQMLKDYCEKGPSVWLNLNAKKNKFIIRWITHLCEVFGLYPSDFEKMGIYEINDSDWTLKQVAEC